MLKQVEKVFMGETNRKIDAFLLDEGAIPIIAQEIVDLFVTQSDKDNLNCDFLVSRVTGQIKEHNVNTNFVTDIPNSTLMSELKMSLFDNDLEAEDDEQVVETEKHIQEWMGQLGDYISDNFQQELEDTIRRILLPDSHKSMIPLDNIRVEIIEIADWSSVPEPSKYTLRIGKLPKCMASTPDIVKAIQELQEKHNYLTAEAAFEVERSLHTVFQNVISIETIDKYLFEFTMEMFVDYSIAKTPPRLDTPDTTKDSE